MPSSTIAITTLAFIGVCVVSDLRTLRIPNLLTGPAIVIGLALNAWLLGWEGARLSLTGFGLAVLLLFVPFALGGIGGGDVKMMGAVGSLLGPHLVTQGLILGVVLGGLFAVVQLARLARLREKLAATWSMFGNAILTRSLEPLKAPASRPDAVALPYSLPLGLGTVVVIAICMVVQS
jgi:prepilin peptidase CpaA